MEVARRIAANAQPHLEPDESVVAAFAAQTVNQIPATVVVSTLVIAVVAFDVARLVEVVLLMVTLALVAWYFIRNQNLIVIATERRTLLATSGALQSTRVDSVIEEGGAEVRFGPATGYAHKTAALGRTIYVQRRFFDQIAEADARR